MYIATEGQCLTPTSLPDSENSSGDYFSLAIYPNPVGEILSFKYNFPFAGKVQIDVMDVNGKSVLSKMVYSGVGGSNTSSLEVKNIAKGFYTLQLSTGKHTSHGKFVKH
jgi:hypothetical protein